MPDSYYAFLLRLWREDEEQEVKWHLQLDHIQSGRRMNFDTLDKLLEFLRQLTEGSATRAPPNI
jgi:hypothetical protein